LEHEVRRESVTISLHRLVEVLDFDAVQGCKVLVEHDLISANLQNPSAYVIVRLDYMCTARCVTNAGRTALAIHGCSSGPQVLDSPDVRTYAGCLPSRARSRSQAQREWLLEIAYGVELERLGGGEQLPVIAGDRDGLSRLAEKHRGGKVEGVEGAYADGERLGRTGEDGT
jgi:hypothetical protein